jgi:hypothetical protein
MLRAVITLVSVVEVNFLIKEVNKVMSVNQYLKHDCYAPIKREWVQRQLQLSQRTLKQEHQILLHETLVSIIILRQVHKNLNFPGVDWAIILYFVTM